MRVIDKQELYAPVIVGNSDVYDGSYVMGTYGSVRGTIKSRDYWICEFDNVIKMAGKTYDAADLKTLNMR